MAVSLSMRIPELSIDRYDRLMVGLELDANPPVGSILHIATESVRRINISRCGKRQSPRRASSSSACETRSRGWA